MSDSVLLFKLEDVLEIIDLETCLPDSVTSSRQKILDYIEIEKKRQDIGEKGEKFVFEREKARLRSVGSRYVNHLSRKPARDPKNGYDIDSFTETGERIHIEVKSTVGDANEPFFMTANEREKAIQVIRNGGIYQVHRVYNVGKDEINVVIYDDFSKFNFEEILYRVEVN